ncbi:MAG: hypothetical protein JSR90_20425 [Proteobacteria bacterium]|nr:hypothetical protein [Pseudomonadota bacterium]
MGNWLASPWQIALSATVPVAMALLLFLLERRGPLARPLQESKGLVAPYFSAIAVVFSLFAALLASDAWRKDTAARAAVEAEADAVRQIVHVARVAGIGTEVLPTLKSYIEAASAEDPYSAEIEADRGRTDKVLERLLTAIVRNQTLDSTSRSLLASSAQSLMKAHDDRLHLATDVTALMKWVTIIVLGTITQVALLLVHIGNRRAQRVAVGLFTVTFSFCLIVVAIFDTPFETILAGEPGATLGVVLRTL